MSDKTSKLPKLPLQFGAPDKALPLLNKVRAFIKDVVQPMSEEFHRLGEGKTDIWSYAPGQLEVLEAAKDKAKAEGLWNFFLPDAHTGEGLSILDYAYIAVELGKNPMSSEVMTTSTGIVLVFVSPSA